MWTTPVHHRVETDSKRPIGDSVCSIEVQFSISRYPKHLSNRNCVENRLRVKRALQASILGFLVLTSGCTGTVFTGTQTTSEATTTETETPTRSATTVAPTRNTTTVETTTQTLPYAVGGDPPKGTNLLSVSKFDEAEAKQVNASARSDFRNLTDARQRAFELAVECDCNVVQEQFRFNDENRVKIVEYGGEYYYLRVAIV